MSYIQPPSIQAIAHSLDVPRLSSEAAKALAPDVEYRLREIIQEAQKFARHSKRVKVTTEDINSALRLRNFEPLFGFSNKDPNKYMRAAGHPDVFFVQDKELAFDQIGDEPLTHAPPWMSLPCHTVMFRCAPLSQHADCGQASDAPPPLIVDEPLPRPPLDVSLMPHWLFINGVQPKIPENAMIERAASKRAKKAIPSASAHLTAGPSQQPSAPAQAAPAGVALQASAPGEPSIVQVQPPVQHALSKELQLYFEKAIFILTSPAAAAALLISLAPCSYITMPCLSLVTLTAGNLHPNKSCSSSSSSRSAWHHAPTSQCPAGPLLPSLQAISILKSPPAAADQAGTSEGAGASSAGLAALSPQQQRLHNAVLESIATDPDGLLQIPQSYLQGDILLAKGIGTHPMDDHWGVRDAAANLVQAVCSQFGDPYFNVPPRISKTLLRTLLDSAKPPHLTTPTSRIAMIVNIRQVPLWVWQHWATKLFACLLSPTADLHATSLPRPYLNTKEARPPPKGLGATKGSAFENGVVSIANGNEAAMVKDKGVDDGNATQLHRAEAWRVYGALVHTVAAAMYDRILKLHDEADKPLAEPRPTVLGSLLGKGKGAKGGKGKIQEKKDDSASHVGVNGGAASKPGVGGPASKPGVGGAAPKPDVGGAASKPDAGGPVSKPGSNPSVGTDADGESKKAASGASRMDVDEGDGAEKGDKSKPQEGGREKLANGDAHVTDAMDVDGAKPAETSIKAPTTSISPIRSVSAVLAEAWREDISTADVLWALSELLGEDFTSKMPHGMLPYCGI
eukprot:gene7790-981_t